jgi:CHASE2 domain-containing sensor protein
LVVTPDPTSDPQQAAADKRVEKVAELLVLGLIVGAFTIALSFLWKGYVYKASDIVQFLSVEEPSGPNRSHSATQLPFRMVVIDIGDRTCREWAMQQYGGLCSALPRFPHAQLAKLFSAMKAAKPKLVVVDIDLHTEQPGADPLDLDLKSLTVEENQIRAYVQAMDTTPFLIAQPLIRQPRDAASQGYDFRPEATILHKLKKDNLRFGEVEQDPGEDGVIRRFRATIPLIHPDDFLNPNAPDPFAVEHLALRVCELIQDNTLCGRQTIAQVQPPGPRVLRFGSLPVSLTDFVQFPYLLKRDVSQLADIDVAVIEARALLSPSFSSSTLDNAIVIVGSTARGRGDYHLTPLDVFGGDTAGVVVIANEVAAALSSRWLENSGWLIIIIEKLGLIILATIVIFFGFWYFYYTPSIHQPKSYGTVRVVFNTIVVWGWFLLVVALAIGINLVCIWFISVRSFSSGELIDPVTPVVAAILDILVDVCAIIKLKAASWATSWAHRWQSTKSG